MGSVVAPGPWSVWASVVVVHRLNCSEVDSYPLCHQRSPERFCFLFCVLMWAIFKVFIEFVTILLLFCVLVFWLWGIWALSTPTRDLTYTPCIEGEILTIGLPGKSSPVFLFYKMKSVSSSLRFPDSCLRPCLRHHKLLPFVFDFISWFHLVVLVFTKVHFALLWVDSVTVLLWLQNHCGLEPGQKM